MVIPQLVKHAAIIGLNHHTVLWFPAQLRMLLRCLRGAENTGCRRKGRTRKARVPRAITLGAPFVFSRKIYLSASSMRPAPFLRRRLTPRRNSNADLGKNLAIKNFRDLIGARSVRYLSRAVFSAFHAGAKFNLRALAIRMGSFMSLWHVSARIIDGMLPGKYCTRRRLRTSLCAIN